MINLIKSRKPWDYKIFSGLQSLDMTTSAHNLLFESGMLLCFSVIIKVLEQEIVLLY